MLKDGMNEKIVKETISLFTYMIPCVLVCYILEK